MTYFPKGAAQRSALVLSTVPIFKCHFVLESWIKLKINVGSKKVRDQVMLVILERISLQSLASKSNTLTLTMLFSFKSTI